MHIALIGPPGSGKGTQSAKISKLYALPSISTGELCRLEAKKKTKQGRFVKKTIDNGKLIPDELMISLLKRRLGKKDCANGFVLDGCPRNMKQVKLLGKNFHIDYAIYVKLSESAIVKRLSGRWQCRKCGNIMWFPTKKVAKCSKCGSSLYQRDDDKPTAIRERIGIFNKLTKPMINYYKKKGVLHQIDGNATPEEVFGRIKKILH